MFHIWHPVHRLSYLGAILFLVPSVCNAITAFFVEKASGIILSFNEKALGLRFYIILGVYNAVEKTSGLFIVMIYTISAVIWR